MWRIHPKAIQLTQRKGSDMRRGIVALCAVTVMVIVIFGSQAAYAQRAVALRTDITDIPTKEAHVITFSIAPPKPGAGGGGGKHFHPGDELVYVVEGAMTFEVDGQPPVTVKTGEAVRLPGKVPHRGFNAGTTDARLVTVGLFTKGEQEQTAVK